MKIWVNLLLAFHQFVRCFTAVEVTYDPIKDVILPSDEHKATVFFLHGQGASGTLQKNYMNVSKNGQTLVLPNLKFIFPTAQKRRFSLHNGRVERIWYDIDCIGLNQTEDSTSMEQSTQGLLKLIHEETNKTGISWNRIGIGGYGMGGKMALHMGYRVLVSVGAIFSISGFLPENSTVFAAIQNSLSQGDQIPELFYGKTELLENIDEEVHEWHEKTYRQLESMGVKCRYSIAHQAGVMMSDSMIEDLWSWLNCTLLSNSD